jgi:cell division protein FtsL
MARSAAAARSRPARRGAAHAPVRRPRAVAAPKRRVSGAAAPARRPEPAPRRSPAGAPLAIRVVRAPFVRACHARCNRLLDRLVHGQGWIVLVGVLLAGIVFSNVYLLQLNRSIAGTAKRATVVKNENAGLRLQLAKLASTERIQRAAISQGLLLPAPGDVRYLRANPMMDSRLAAKRMVAPGSEQVASAPAPEPQAAPVAATPVTAAPQPQAQAQPAPEATATPPSAPITPPAAAVPTAGAGTTAAPTG